jgi:hypothetical protein
MSFYKDIKWDNKPIDKLLEVISIPINPRPYVAPIDQDTQLKIVDVLGIDIKKYNYHNFMLVHLKPNSKFTIHSDKPLHTLEDGKLEQAIFVPLQNCENVKWYWYELIDQSKVFYHSEDYKPVPMILDDAAREVAQTDGNKAMITDIGNFHRLTNTGTDSAYALSLRFMPWGWQPFKDCVELPPIPNLSLL